MFYYSFIIICLSFYYSKIFFYNYVRQQNEEIAMSNIQYPKEGTHAVPVGGVCVFPTNTVSHQTYIKWRKIIKKPNASEMNVNYLLIK